MKTIRVKESQLEAMEQLGIQYEEAEEGPPNVWKPCRQGDYVLLGDGEVTATILGGNHTKIGNSYYSKTLASKDTDLFKRQMLIRAYDREFGRPDEDRKFTVQYRYSDKRWDWENTLYSYRDGSLDSRQDPQTCYLGQTAATKLSKDLNECIVVLPGMDYCRER